MVRPELSIVVLQWNRADLTRSCVASLREHTPVDHEMIIVDNGSDDEARVYARSHADTAVLLDENLGFAKGMNAGLEVVTAPSVAFVNNDTTFPADWASTLLETGRNDRYGIVAPAVSSAGNQSSVRERAGDGVSVVRRFIDLPSGVVYLMRTDLIRALGGWSEDYEMASAEDLDLLFAVWSIGLDVALDERVFVHHIGSATADHLAGKGRIWASNRKIFASTWMDMDEDRFRRRYEWTGPVDDDRLAEARIAAYWMQRLFTASEDAPRGAADPTTGPSTTAPSIQRLLPWRRRSSNID